MTKIYTKCNEKLINENTDFMQKLKILLLEGIINKSFYSLNVVQEIIKSASDSIL